MSENNRIKIVLDDNFSVEVNPAKCPIIASADTYSNNDYFGTGSQATRTTRWHVAVRQGEDGDERVIVYAMYKYTGIWRSEPDITLQRGQLIPTSEELVATIEAVCADMARRTHAEGRAEDALVWARLAQECIADLTDDDI